MGTLENTHVEEFVYSVNNSRCPSQGRNLHSHKVSFLGFLPSSLVLTQIISMKSSLALLSLLLTVSLHHNSVLVLLCAKQPQTQTALILSSLLLALIRAVTVSYCPDAAHFLLCLFVWVFFVVVVVVFFFRGSSNAFQVVGSIRFGLVLQIGFFTVYCLIIYKTCKGQLCTVNGLFQKTFP